MSTHSKTKLYFRTVGVPMSLEMVGRLEELASYYRQPVAVLVRSMVENGLTAAADVQPVVMPWERQA